LEEPVDYHAAFDSTLRMEDEDYFREFLLVQGFLDDLVAVPDILRGVVEVALN